MKILCTGTMAALGLKMLEKEGHQVFQLVSKSILTTEQLIDHCKAYDALISTATTPLNKDFFEASSHLKAVVLLQANYDHIQPKWATKNNIPVGAIPSGINQAVAETTLMLMMASSRQINAQHNRILTNQWARHRVSGLTGQSLAYKTLGIFGLGNIGQQVVHLCRRTFGMNVIYHNRIPNQHLESTLDVQYVPIEDLLEKSDVLSVHATLNEDSSGFFDAKAFYAMKRSAIFINTADGKIHDHNALTRAVYEGWIWGAGLDVTDPSPLVGSDPLINHPHVCITPRIALDTYETQLLISKIAAKNLIAALREEKMPDCINPIVYRYINHK